MGWITDTVRDLGDGTYIKFFPTLDAGVVEGRIYDRRTCREVPGSKRSLRCLFPPHVSPSREHYLDADIRRNHLNQAVSEQGLEYDSDEQAYVDSRGRSVMDKYGNTIE
ncbi:hypothetical protein HYT24_01830 [Candidatus Pacearchaeota archaeon]|nr:hypothetical protein [Candidatus Pacearchaeota archaeon]